MKWLTALVGVATVAVAGVASANLLLNPGFETPQGDAEQAADWNRFGDWANRRTLTPDGWDPRTDNALVAWQYYAETGANAGWWQEVTGLTDGGNYDFSVYVKKDVDYNGGNINIKVEPIGGGAALLFQTYTMAQVGTDWTYVNVTGSLGSGVTGGRFTIEALEQNVGDHQGSIKFDDSNLDLVAIPEPATLGLLGLSVLGILAMRRRVRG